MKKVLTLSLLLAVTIIMLSSCSHLSIKSQSLATIYVEINTENNNLTLQAMSDDFQVKGYCPEPIVIGDSQEKIGEKIESISSESSILNGNIANKIQRHKNVLASINNSDVKSIIGNNPGKFNDFNDRPTTYQPVNYSGHRSSGGLPLWFMVVLAIFIPPLAVGIMYGIVDKFWISLVLTLLFWIPGVIYALIQVLA